MKTQAFRESWQNRDAPTPGGANGFASCDKFTACCSGRVRAMIVRRVTSLRAEERLEVGGSTGTANSLDNAHGRCQSNQFFAPSLARGRLSFSRTGRRLCPRGLYKPIKVNVLSVVRRDAGTKARATLDSEGAGDTQSRVCRPRLLLSAAHAVRYAISPKSWSRRGGNQGSTPPRGNRLRVVVRRDDQFLPYFDLVRVFNLVAVGVEDSHVLVRVAVELPADLRERVARLHRVSLPG